MSTSTRARRRPRRAKVSTVPVAGWLFTGLVMGALFMFLVLFLLSIVTLSWKKIADAEDPFVFTRCHSLGSFTACSETTRPPAPPRWYPNGPRVNET